MEEKLRKKEIKDFYKDAMHEHMSREDDLDYRAEVKLRRYMAFYEEL